jgi:carboxylesterase
VSPPARSRAHRLETLVAERLPVGASGIIPGAEAIALSHAGPRAALLVHGFGDTPQTLRYLARDLHAAGWAVRAPLLPGHGRSLRDFAASRHGDWIALVRRDLDALRAEYPTVALVGLSMGGALATIVASMVPDLAALVLAAPYLGMPLSLRAFARFHRLAALAWPWVDGGAHGASIRDRTEAAGNLAYGVTTPALVAELRAVVREAWAALPRVPAPTLIVQSRGDNRVAPDVAVRALARLASAEKELVWIDEGAHVITVDFGRDRVSAAVLGWLAAHDRQESNARYLSPP